MTQKQLNTLNQLFEEEKHEELIAEVEANEDVEVDQSFVPSLALSYFHTRNYAKSTSLFEQLVEGTQNPIAWFNLCTSAILNNDDRKGLDALHHAKKYNHENEISGEGIPTPFMIFYAARAFVDVDKYNQAFNQLNELAEIYGSLSITDSHFLHARGVPFFSEFVNLSGEILKKQTVTDCKDWLAYISSRLDEGGREQMNEILGKA